MRVSNVVLSKTRTPFYYSRHLIVPDVAMDGQKRLKNAKVLVVGAGGLGSPALLYLAAAGVGTLGIVDFDVVDESNLQRQVIHGQSDIGRPKAESARDSITEINPLVKVNLHLERLDSSNVLVSDVIKRDMFKLKEALEYYRRKAPATVKVPAFMTTPQWENEAQSMNWSKFDDDADTEEDGVCLIWNTGFDL